MNKNVKTEEVARLAPLIRERTNPMKNNECKTKKDIACTGSSTENGT